MGLNKTLKGWVNIPVEEKEIIKKCLNDFNRGAENKVEALNTLFEMYNTYMGGGYGNRGRTCGTCVRTVIVAFTSGIAKEAIEENKKKVREWQMKNKNNGK